MPPTLSEASPFGPDRRRTRRSPRAASEQELASRLTLLALAPLDRDISKDIRQIEAEAAALQDKQTHERGSNFTTQYAREWGKRKGYTILASELWDTGTRKSNDIGPGADVLFATSQGNLYVQAAGQGERADHFARFQSRGGASRCKKSFARFLYLVFVRGNPEPVSFEWWA